MSIVDGVCIREVGPKDRLRDQAKILSCMMTILTDDSRKANVNTNNNRLPSSS